MASSAGFQSAPYTIDACSRNDLTIGSSMDAFASMAASDQLAGRSCQADLGLCQARGHRHACTLPASDWRQPDATSTATHHHQCASRAAAGACVVCPTTTHAHRSYSSHGSPRVANGRARDACVTQPPLTSRLPADARDGRWFASCTHPLYG